MRRFLKRLECSTVPALLLATQLASSGCGAASGNGDPDAGDVAPFVAVQGDFACYRGWNAFDGGTAASDGLNALNAERTIYINHLPAPGSTTFPIGTIIVKDTATAPTFAMAKRGGGFNPEVDGWEWFELIIADTTPASACTPRINWRGTAAPAGTIYGTVTTTCNQCHVLAGSATDPNDYVAGSALQLAHF